MASKVVTLTARGVYLQPNDLGEVPDGALAQADDVVISRDGIVEPRRGAAILATKALGKLAAHRGVLVGQDPASNSLRYSDATGAAWTDYAGSYSAPFRSAALNGNLYFTTGIGPYRLDAVAGTPEPQGIPDALDCQATLAGAGTALATNAESGYRLIFAKRDANGNLILGGPSSRAVVSNAAGSTQDVSVAYSLPHSLPSGAFVQLYKTRPSASSSVDPGDECGLVYEGPVPLVQALTQLQRATNVITATSAQPHGYSTGMIVNVSPGGSLPGFDAAIGSASAVQRSTDNGVTWSGAGISGLPAGTYYAAASNGGTTAVVGASVAATSSDGLTYTPRTIPAGTYRGVAFGTGGRAVAVGDNGITAYSTDNGATWSPGATIGSGLWNCTAALWDGAKFVLVANAQTGTQWGFYYSLDGGATWNAAMTATGGAQGYGLAFTGSNWIVVGSKGGVAYAWYTADVSLSSSVTAVSLVDSGQATAVCWTGTATVAIGNTGKAYYSASFTPGVVWNSTALAGTWNACIWDSVKVIAAGASVAATCTANGQTWTGRTIAAGAYNAVVPGGGAYFAAGEKVVTGTPTGSSFTYAETGTDGTLVQAQTATPLTGAILDQTPSGFIGASLYTNESQGSMAAAASKLKGARDVAMFRGVAFWANISYPSSAQLYLLGVGSPAGVQTGDQIIIDGLAYTAGASESISGRTFLLTTSGTAAQNLFATAASLIRIINRTQSNTITARDISLATDPGPVIYLQENGPSNALTVSFSGHASAWSLRSLQAPTQQVNELRWSQPQQPDVTPLLNSARIGGSDKAILRIVTTRDSLFIFKEDGLWKLSGYSAPWDIQPFDPTCILRAPDTAVMLDNSVFALTNQGAVRVADTGVQVISRPIEPALLPLLSPSMMGTTSAVAFSVAYESARKLYLWLPTLSTDTQATQAWVYDLFTQAWTRDTRDESHGIVNPVDDRLYLVDGTSVRRERKDFADTDYQDDSGPINTVVQWSPKFGDPSQKSHFSVLSFMFRKWGGTTASLSCTTELVTTPQTVAFNLTDYGTPPFAPFTLRTWTPLECMRASQLNLKWSQSVNGASYQLQGVGIVTRSTSEEGGY